jgi:hypothetical protein
VPDKLRFTLACCIVGLALAGCGGSGSSGGSMPPAAGGSAAGGTATTTTASATFPLTGSASTQTLPSAGGIAGTLALPAVTSAPAGATMTVTSSTTAPAGAPQPQSLQRNPQSGTLTVFFFTTVRVNQTVTLPQLPGFSLTLPSSISTTGGTFFYAISDPTVSAPTVQFRTEGPAGVNGQVVTFIASPNPLTLQAGLSYVIAFYRITGPPNGQYSLLQNVNLPNYPTTSGPPASFDISFVDPRAGQYYLADRTNAAVDVVDTKTLSLVGMAKGFKGAVLLNPTTVNNNVAGPNGVVPIGGGLLAAGDGDSTLKIVNIASLSIVATQLSAKNPFTGTLDPKVAAGCVDPAGGVTSNQFRLDELAFDPADSLVLAINDADCPPYGTFFSSKAPYNVVGAISFGTSFNGLEQPVWDPGQHVFLQANPQTLANPNGEIDVIDPHSFAITKVYPIAVNCQPHGLALGPSERIVVGCSVPNSQILVLDATNGNTVGSVVGYGGSDECWYDNGSNRYYCALSNQTPNPLLIAIDAGTNQLIATVQTSTQAHSVAADSATNHVFVPQRTVGISVFTF